MKEKLFRISLISLITLILASCGNQMKEKEEGKLVLSPNGNDIKGKILFDSAHGQTAGSADWIINGGFSDFADALTKQNYEVTDLGYKQLLDYEKMRDYQVVVIPEANNPFKSSEQKAIEKYVKNGGSILMISDHYNADRNFNRFDSSEVMNGYRRGAFEDATKGMSVDERQSDMMNDVKSNDFLNEVFGLRFRYNALGNIKVSDIESPKLAFDITSKVKAVSMHAGSTIAITDPKKSKGIAFVPKLTKHDAWNHAVDQGIYNNGGREEGPYIAISKVGKGKGAFIGDSSMLEDKTPKYKREDNGENKKTYDGLREEDNEKMAIQLVNWLNKQENSKDLTVMKGKLDKPTPIHSFEEPNNSTEPRKEPWGNPAKNYKWFNRSTYHPDSFGQENNKNKVNKIQSNNNKSQDNMSEVFTMPKTVEKHEPFKISVHVDENKIENGKIQLSIKNQDGREVGMFNGKRPDISEAVSPKIVNGKTDWYFKTKIANEAEDEVVVEVHSGNKVIASTNLRVK